MPNAPSGVYAVLHEQSGSLYVGSAMNLWDRWGGHLRGLRAGSHHSRYLQRAWNKYGERAFHFTIIEECIPVDLVGREQHWMNCLRPEYNMSPTAGSCLGMRHTSAAIARISAAKMGHKHTPEARAKISAALTGRLGTKHTPEARTKISVAAMGRKPTPETRAKISASHTGKPLSPEHRAKLMGHRNALGHKLSPETRAGMSAALTGRKLSPEHCAKLSVAKLGNKNSLGRKHSPETLAKMSAAGKGHHKVTPDHRAKLLAGYRLWRLRSNKLIS